MSDSNKPPKMINGEVQKEMQDHIWQDVLEAIKPRLSVPAFTTWFCETEGMGG